MLMVAALLVYWQWMGDLARYLEWKNGDENERA